MIVKVNEKQLSFLFQEADPYFEMGYMILEQAQLSGMLPFKRMEQNGKEKLLFQISKFIPLSEMVPILEQNEIIDVLYAMIFMTQKVEENGFLKKECIWCKYEHIYYDEASKKPLFAVLPISKEFRYADGMDWNNRFLDAITHVASFLPPVKFNRVLNLVSLWRTEQMDCEAVLEAINELGSGMSGMLVDRTVEEPEKKLSLVYSGREGTYQFDVSGEEFVIGKNPDVVDGAIQLSDAMSRKHCKIIKQSNRFFVQDLGSVNHTFVNGEYIPPFELMELNQSDILTLADIDLRVHISE